LEYENYNTGYSNLEGSGSDTNEFRKNSMMLVERLVENAENIEFNFQNKENTHKRLCDNTLGLIDH
jgi:hypothetical protein